jgi:hypothetical protein
MVWSSFPSLLGLSAIDDEHRWDKAILDPRVARSQLSSKRVLIETTRVFVI